MYYYLVKENIVRGKFQVSHVGEAHLWAQALNGEVVNGEVVNEYWASPRPILKNKCRVLPGEISPGQYARLTCHLDSSKMFLEGEAHGRKDRSRGTYSLVHTNKNFVDGYYYGYYQ